MRGRAAAALAVLAAVAAGFAPRAGMAPGAARRAARGAALRSVNNPERDEGAREPDGMLLEIANDMRFGRARLELLHTMSIVRRKPKFLAYNRARRWAARLGIASAAEWREWISMGEKRNTYIPSRPDEYYSELGVWRGWDHWLGLDDEAS